MANASQSLIQAPNFTGVIDQKYFLEPLGGPNHPYSYLDRFPDTVYNLSPLGHLVKFLYVFLGPAGVAGEREAYLQLRLVLQEHGLQFFKLDQFYGNPFAFGRLLQEQYTTDPTGLLTQQQLDEIRVADASYRNRAIDFMNAARAGNSPTGIYLAARSGLGHEVEVIENYRFLYDLHTDDPMGIPYMGSTLSTEEAIILPRQDISRSEAQTVGISTPPAGGFFTLSFDGHETQPIAPTATRLDIQEFLESLPNIGKGNVIVEGGPGPSVPWEISFTGALSGRNVPEIEFHSSLLTMQEAPYGIVDTTIGGIEATDEVVNIPAQDQKYMMDALDQIKPMTMITTFNEASGTRSRTPWKNVIASSELVETIRYVTGKQDTTTWIQANIENQAPVPAARPKHHYEAFHRIQRANAYTDDALSDPNYGSNIFNSEVYKYASQHFGSFTSLDAGLTPVIRTQKFSGQFSAQWAIDPYPYLLTYDYTDYRKGIVVVNQWYPIEVYDQIYKDTGKYVSSWAFWASLERPTGTDYLELDLGGVQGINYISFEITHKPLSVDIAYDVLDDPHGRRRFFPVAPSPTQGYESSITFAQDVGHPWQFVEFNFSDGAGKMIFSRYIRIGFTRTTSASPYIDANGVLHPYSVNVRRLRIGRSTFIDDKRLVLNPNDYLFEGKV